MRNFKKVTPQSTRSLFLGVLFLSLSLWPYSQVLALTQDVIGRLGVGMSQHFANQIPALSLKLQRSNSFAFGAILGLRTNDTRGGMGAGLRAYKIIFDEPLLNFYAAGTAAYITAKTKATSSSGYQFDASLGSEFHFSGLESIGFSFEFGLSFNKLYDEFTIETVGHHLITAGIHFYL